MTPRLRELLVLLTTTSITVAAQSPSKWRGGPGPTSEMDDTRSIIYTLASERPLRGPGGLTHEPTLAVRCKERKLDALLLAGFPAQQTADTRDYSRASAQITARAPVAVAKVRVRFDSEPAEEEYLTETVGSKSTFALGGIEFAKRIANAKELKIEFTPVQSPAQVIPFQVSGFKTRLKVLLEACDSKQPAKRKDPSQ